MHTTLRRLVLVFAVLVPHTSVWGHHSVSAIFDQSKVVSITGTLTKVEWTNPHIAVLVDVTAATGVESWRLQSSPPAWWKNVGVNRADFAKGMGQRVTIAAYPAQDGSRYAYMRKITFANGDSLESTSTQ